MWEIGTTFKEFQKLRNEGKYEDYDLSRGVDFSEVEESLVDYVEDYKKIEPTGNVEQMQFILFSLKENGAIILPSDGSPVIVKSI